MAEEEETSERKGLENTMWKLGLENREGIIVLYYEFMKKRSTRPYERTLEFMSWLKKYGHRESARWR